jgi:hypothetical protein
MTSTTITSTSNLRRRSDSGKNKQVNDAPTNIGNIMGTIY